MRHLLKSIYYRGWIIWCWLTTIMFPVVCQLSISVRRQLVWVGLVVVSSLPINYYLFSPPHDMQANASESVDLELPPQNKVLVPTLLSERDAPQQNQPESSEVTQEKIPPKPQDPKHELNVLKPPPSVKETAVDHAKKHMDPTFVCPMHSEIISTDPNATCPLCGMDLVALEFDGDANIVKLLPNVINTLGVRVSPVKKRTIYRRINSVGYIAYDENRIRTVSLRTEGWVERLAVKSVGERVKKGALLFEIYSPSLINAQEEYVQALQLDSGDGLMIQASRQRLAALGVSDEQVEILQNMQDVQALVRILAPQDGVISELNIREGMFVLPSKPVISLVDLSSIWLLADVFENQVDWVKAGQKAEASLSFSPDKKWTGTVEYVYPSLDPMTRSIKARLRFDNPGELLKPNMYANVTIFVNPRKKVLVIPEEALIQTADQQRVIVALGEGRYQPRVVRAGVSASGRVEILNGLEEGENVVISSQFLIDSESSMRASLLRLVGGATVN